MGPAAVVTIQKTAKKYKGAQLVFGALLLVGVCMALGKMPSGALVGLVGFVGYGCTRASIWWNHG